MINVFLRGRKFKHCRCEYPKFARLHWRQTEFLWRKKQRLLKEERHPTLCPFWG